MLLMKDNNVYSRENWNVHSTLITKWPQLLLGVLTVSIITEKAHISSDKIKLIK